MPDLVKLRVHYAIESGVDGIVASPLEAPSIRAQAGPKAILVTPGMRSAGAGKGDQKRVATPAEALSAGANYVVMRRQITRSPEMARVLEEIAAGVVAGPPAP